MICGLLFFATTVNYIDRQLLGILSKDLKDSIGWTEVDYGNIVAAFNAAYAFGLLLGRWAFILTGAIGFFWLLFWLPIYRRPEQHPNVSKAELDHIQSDPPDPPAMSFFRDNHGLDVTTIGPPLIAIYLIADIGSIGGGWLSSTFIKRGWTINRSRKTAMLICALMVTPIIFAANV